MPLFFVKDNIVNMKCDAIVNAANNTLLGGGGVDGAIHSAAGPELFNECLTLNGCETGEAKITKGYNLPAKHIIHTVGPVWRGGDYNEEETLRSCYRSSIRLAEENNCASVAFPLISAGVYGYPRSEAIKVAVSEISSCEKFGDMDFYLVFYGGGRVSGGCPEALKNNLARNFLQSSPKKRLYSLEIREERVAEAARAYNCDEAVCAGPCEERYEEAPGMLSIEEAVGELDESFSEMVFRKIREQGITDAECYKRANIDRKLFSRMNRPDYKPTKTTALAFAVALRLPTAEAEELLRKAGFAFSGSSKLDIIVKYYITNSMYDIMEINSTLFDYDQPLLGSFARER